MIFNRFIITLFLGLIIPVFQPYSVYADTPVHAIAMHGNVAHDNDFKHLPYANPNAPKGGVLKNCSIGSFDTLNDNTMKGKPAEALHLLNDPLMRRVWDEPFSLYGVIAEKVIIPQDRSSITFILNPKARFHNGDKISTNDVEYSFNTLKEKGKPNTRNVYKLVNNIQTIDPQTIKFSFGDGYDRETAMILAMMPIYSEKYWKDKEFDATTLTPPLGNGPYKIKAVEQGKSITYEKVNDYWAADLPIHVGHYNPDILQYDYYRDEQVALEAFKSGECDFRRETDPAKWLANYKDDQNYIREEISHSRPEPARGFIFNTRKQPFQNIKVRQALTLAFDFDWMNKSLFGGKTKRINSTFPNSVLSSDISQPQKSKRENLMIADKLLTEAGFPLVNGKRFEMTLLLNNPSEEKIALGFARDLKRLGITLKIRTLDTAQFFGALNDYDFDLVSWRWINSLSPGSEQMIYWGCDAAKNKGSRNFSGVCDPEIEKAAQSIANTTDYNDLKTKAKKLDKLLMDKYLFIPLYYTGVDYIARTSSLKRPETSSLYGVVLETWWKK